MQRLILASSSPRRLSLLESISIHPDEVISPNINEQILPKEKPEKLALRLALDKANSMKIEKGFILSADTIVSTKSKVFDKANTREEVEKFLNSFSGRRIAIHSAIAALQIESGEIVKSGQKLVTSIVKFKRFSHEEIQHYLDSNHGVGIAGGFAIQGLGETLVKWMSGSYSGIVGLPLYETVSLLKGVGYHAYNKAKS